MSEYDLLFGVSVRDLFNYFLNPWPCILHIQSGAFNSTCRMKYWHEAIDCHWKLVSRIMGQNRTQV